MVRLPATTPLPTAIAPPAPPDPKMALLPLTQTLSATPSDQLAFAVEQLPAPSVGAVGLAPVASQVTVSPSALWTSPNRTAKINPTITRRSGRKRDHFMAGVKRRRFVF